MIDRILEERYELLELIGSGGMADVYRARDQLLDRPVAVKILHAQFKNDTEFIGKFHREAQAAALLQFLLTLKNGLLARCVITGELSKAHDEVTDGTRLDVAGVKLLHEVIEDVVIIGGDIEGALMVQSTSASRRGISDEERDDLRLGVCRAQTDTKFVDDLFEHEGGLRGHIVAHQDLPLAKARLL